MTDLCGICEETLDDLPKTELPCHHTYHTHCFLVNLGTAEPDQLFRLRCVACQEHIFPQEEELEEEEEEQENQSDNESTDSYVNESTRVSNLFDTNEEFRKDILKYVKASRAVSKPKSAFKKLVATKKTEITPTWAQIKAQYEGLYNVKKNDIMSSNEYKEFRSAEAKVARYWTLLREKYDVRSYSIHGLRDKRGCKTIHRPNTWRGSPKFIIRHALRLRLPYF